MNTVTCHATFPEEATELLERSSCMLVVPLSPDDLTGLEKDMMELVKGSKAVAANLQSLRRVMAGLKVEDPQLDLLVRAAEGAAARAHRVAVVIGRGTPAGWGLPGHQAAGVQ